MVMDIQIWFIIKVLKIEEKFFYGLALVFAFLVYCSMSKAAKYQPKVKLKHSYAYTCFIQRSNGQCNSREALLSAPQWHNQSTTCLALLTCLGEHSEIADTLFLHLISTRWRACYFIALHCTYSVMLHPNHQDSQSLKNVLVSFKRQVSCCTFPVAFMSM